jgi:preprotein translocase subunit SecF
MKSPIKLENDFREFSKAEKVILAVVLALVVLVVISWAADGFAYSQEYKVGYNPGVKEWNQFSTDLSHHFECPFSNTVPHSDFCKGYDAALMFETSDR